MPDGARREVVEREKRGGGAGGATETFKQIGAERLQRVMGGGLNIMIEQIIITLIQEQKPWTAANSIPTH